MPEAPTMTDEEATRRGIYPFEAGGVRTLTDPLKVLNRMQLAVPEFDRLVKRMFDQPPKGETPEEAERRIAEETTVMIALEPAVLAGFQLQPLAPDGSGASVEECMAILGRFMGWQFRKIVEADAALVPESPATEQIPETVRG